MSTSDRAPSRTLLFAPFVGLIVVVVAHAAYWTYAASQIEKAALEWIETQQAAGYEVGYDSLRVGGYPFRFALRAQAPRLTAPTAEGGWTAEVEQLSASAQFYDLNHWIVSPSGVGQVESQGETYRVTSDSARLSLRASDGTTARIGASVDNLVIETAESREPTITAMGSLVLTGFLDDTDQLMLRLQIEDIVLGEDALDPAMANAFGRSASLMRLDAAITQWSALARRADPLDWRLANGALVINQSQLIWGPAELSGDGEIGLDADLQPEGRLSIVVTDPETLISALEEAGMVIDEQGAALRLAALMAPRQDGGIPLPLRLREGGVFFGPARIGTFAE